MRDVTRCPINGQECANYFCRGQMPYGCMKHIHEIGCRCQKCPPPPTSPTTIGND